jgi:hypothetical protein
MNSGYASAKSQSLYMQGKAVGRQSDRREK